VAEHRMRDVIANRVPAGISGGNSVDRAVSSRRSAYEGALISIFS
jgi:hypothetical protein